MRDQGGFYGTSQLSYSSTSQIYITMIFALETQIFKYIYK